MYRAHYDKNTEKGRTQLLLSKRNMQFATMFQKLRDPISILQAHNGLNKVYKKYFDNEKKSVEMLKILTYLYDKDWFFSADMKELFGLSDFTSRNVLMKMGWKKLLRKDEKQQTYCLSAEGHLFLRNFSKESVNALCAVIKNGRKGKPKKEKKIVKKWLLKQ